MEVHIRWMIRRDYEEVLTIEKEGVELPWLKDDLLRALKKKNCIGMVAEYEERIVGHMAYSRYPDRIVIETLAVAYDCRRQGVGTALINKLKLKTTDNRRRLLDMMIRETNRGAVEFLVAQGFRGRGLARHPWCELDEDAYRMRWHVTWQAATTSQ